MTEVSTEYKSVEGLGSYFIVPTPSPRYLLIFAVLLLSLVLTACDSGDDESTEAAEVTQDNEATETVEADGEQSDAQSLDDLRARVVRELRTLMEIETATHSVETLVEREAEGGLFSSDKLLLVAHGSVTAGVDLIAIGDTNVELVDHKTIRISLPDSEILSSNLDRSRTQVVSRETGLLGSEDEGLEAEAFEEAEIKILQSACDHNILERASEEAEFRITALLSGLGFESISVDSSAGTCS